MPIESFIHFLYLWTKVYTAGLFASAQPFSHDEIPTAFPLYTAAPPPSPLHGATPENTKY